MKLSRKIVGILMSMSLLIMLVPTVVYAGDGRISFTDLTTEAGEEFEIRVRVTSESDELGSINVVLNYDSDLIQFVSGDNVTQDGSTLYYSTIGSDYETATYITFLALQEGDATITIESQEVLGTDGTVIDISEGNSAINISGGTPVEVTETEVAGTSGSADVEVSGVTYSLDNSFTESVIPAGYTSTTYDYEDGTFSGVVGDTSGIILGYLVDDSGEGQFFYFDDETATFYPYVQVTVSETANIVFLTSDIEGTLPSEYVETVLTVNGFEFPTWEDTSTTGYYLIHALNSDGEESVYRYDSQDQTYQRFSVDTTSEESVEAETTEEAQYLQWVLIGCGALGVILLVVIIILVVKLRNRDLELDDLYDELEFGKKPAAPVKKSAPVKKELPKKTPERKALENKEPEKKKLEKKPMKKEMPKDEFDDFFDDQNDFDDDFDDDFDKFDKFDDDFEVGFKDELADAYEKDDYSKELVENFEVKKPEKQVREGVKPRRSIKAAAKKKPVADEFDDDIDFLDI